MSSISACTSRACAIRFCLPLSGRVSATRHPPLAQPRSHARKRFAPWPPSEWVTLQRNAYQRFSQLVADLTDEQLKRSTSRIRQGQRSIRWFCTQLLAEIAFHRWDLERSLGSQAPLDDGLAAYLLPFLLDPAEPLFGSLRAPFRRRDLPPRERRPGVCAHHDG